jgi:two-component system, NtrC family, response regulator HydG
MPRGAASAASWSRRVNQPVVLLVDDDPGVRFTLAEVLSEAEVEVIQAADGLDALAKLSDRPVDLVITDLKMPKMDGMTLLAEIKKKDPHAKVVMITAHGSEAAAVEAMKLGAYDYFPKPFDVDAVAMVVKRATQAVRLESENRRLKAELVLARRMVFRSERMMRVAELVERIARRDVTVLITGKSGTGKELVARALVEASARSSQPYVTFNCAAIAKDLAEAELFGHKEGAFTGATSARAGLFRRAHGGTIFLDEIAELDPEVQGKLLRVFQEGEVRPVGEDRAVKVDVRIISATHRDLHAEVEAGRFREDLFYRLNVVRIELPPLSERPEDLEPLIDHFVKKYAERFGIENPRLAPHARQRLLERTYPGNVRELENAVERMVALATDSTIDDSGGAEVGATDPLGLKERVDAYERGLILAELKHSGWNRSEAARRLKIGRVTLLDKLKKHNVSEEE